MENIALILAIVAMVFSGLVVIVMLLLRKNIVEILKKDSIIFDKNFEIKERAILNSIKLAEDVLANGKQLVLNPSFNKAAKTCYNELICVLNNLKISDAFRDIALDINKPISESLLVIYRMLCREDLGFKVKQSFIEKEVAMAVNNQPTGMPMNNPNFVSQPQQPQQARPVNNMQRPPMQQNNYPNQPKN